MFDRRLGVPLTPVRQDAMTFEVLAPNCGIEVKGIDLRDEISDGDLRKIEDAWLEHCVFLVRGQNLDEEAQMRFATRFGDVGKLINNSPGRISIPGIMYISNIRENGVLTGSLPDGEMYFHSDQCYVEVPAKATILYGIEIPKHGGNTLFANMFKAWDTLPGALKKRVEGLVAINVYDYENNPTQRGSRIGEGVPHFAHPVVRTHPATGRKALYVNRLITDHIVGLDNAESDELLGAIFSHCEQDEFIYEHTWQPGDILMWDNRSTIHARRDFDASERRQLRRVTLLGDRPV